MKRRNLFVNALFVALLVLLSSSDLVAQSGGGANRQAKGESKGQIDAETATKTMVARLDKNLELTSDQEKEVSSIYLAIAEGNAETYEAKMKEVKAAKSQNSGDNCDEDGKTATKVESPNIFAQSSTQATATEAKMKKILSEEQYTKWISMNTLSETKESPKSQSKGAGSGQKAKK